MPIVVQRCLGLSEKLFKYGASREIEVHLSHAVPQMLLSYAAGACPSPVRKGPSPISGTTGAFVRGILPARYHAGTVSSSCLHSCRSKTPWPGSH